MWYLSVLFYHHQCPNCIKHLHQGLNPGQFWRIPVILTETNRFSLGVTLSLCWATETSLPGLKQIFVVLAFIYIISSLKTAVVFALSHLMSELPSLGLKLRTFPPEIWHSKISSWSRAMFGANRFIHSSNISKHTYKTKI